MKEAGMNAIRRVVNIMEEKNPLDEEEQQSTEYCIVFSDIQHALKKVQPSA